MKLKYRIKEYTFPFSPTLYGVQYKIFGIWVWINNNITGSLIYKHSCYIYSKEDAKDRIRLHKDNMERSKDWWNKSKTTYEVW